MTDTKKRGSVRSMVFKLGPYVRAPFLPPSARLSLFLTSSHHYSTSFLAASGVHNSRRACPWTPAGSIRTSFWTWPRQRPLARGGWWREGGGGGVISVWGEVGAAGEGMGVGEEDSVPLSCVTTFRTRPGASWELPGTSWVLPGAPRRFL